MYMTACPLFRGLSYLIKPSLYASYQPMAALCRGWPTRLQSPQGMTFWHGMAWHDMGIFSVKSYASVSYSPTRKMIYLLNSRARSCFRHHATP